MRVLLLLICASSCGGDSAPDCRVPPYDAGADAEPVDEVLVWLPPGCDLENLDLGE